MCIRDRDDEEPEITVDAVMTFSANEVLQQTDFEKMSNEELEAAKRAIARMRLPIMEVPTRRFRRDTRGNRIDMRATLRAALRGGGTSIPLQYRKRKRRHPPPRRALRYLGLDEPILAHDLAFHARRNKRP